MSTQERGPRALGRKIADRLRIGKNERTVIFPEERTRDFAELITQPVSENEGADPSIFTFLIRDPKHPSIHVLRKTRIDLSGRRIQPGFAFQFTPVPVQELTPSGTRDINGSGIASINIPARREELVKYESDLGTSSDPKMKARAGIVMMVEYKGDKRLTTDDVFNLTVDKLGYDLQEKRRAEKTKHF